MIKLQAIGNLGKDCITNNVNGKSVINFSVAHTEKYKDAQGQQKDKTLWVECAYWTDRLAIVPYLKKGTMVYVEGTPDIRMYQTKEGGQAASLQLRVLGVQLLGGRNGETSGSEGQQSAPAYSGNSNNYGGNNGGNQATSNVGSDLNEPADDLPF